MWKNAISSPNRFFVFQFSVHSLAFISSDNKKSFLHFKVIQFFPAPNFKK